MYYFTEDHNIGCCNSARKGVGVPHKVPKMSDAKARKLLEKFNSTHESAVDTRSRTDSKLWYKYPTGKKGSTK